MTDDLSRDLFRGPHLGHLLASALKRHADAPVLHVGERTIVLQVADLNVGLLYILAMVSVQPDDTTEVRYLRRPFGTRRSCPLLLTPGVTGGKRPGCGA